MCAGEGDLRIVRVRVSYSNRIRLQSLTEKMVAVPASINWNWPYPERIRVACPFMLITRSATEITGTRALSRPPNLVPPYGYTAYSVPRFSAAQRTPSCRPFGTSTTDQTTRLDARLSANKNGKLSQVFPVDNCLDHIRSDDRRRTT